MCSDRMLRRDVTHRWHSCSQTLRRACDATTAGTSVLLLPEAERSLVLRCSGLWQHSGAMTTGATSCWHERSVKAAGVHHRPQQRCLTAVSDPLPSLWIQAAERPIATVRRAAAAAVRLRPRCEPERAVAAAASVLWRSRAARSGALARQIWKLSMPATHRPVLRVRPPPLSFRPNLRNSSAEHRPAAAGES